MRCISIRPPWAWCIVHLPGEARWKDVENRSRNSRHRGPLLIHASGTLTRSDYDDACRTAREAGCSAAQLPTFEALARLRGGIIGAVELFDVSAPGYEPDDRPSSPWRHDDCFAYHLRNRIVLPHRPLLGKLGIYDVPITAAESRLLAPAGLAA